MLEIQRAVASRFFPRKLGEPGFTSKKVIRTTSHNVHRFTLCMTATKATVRLVHSLHQVALFSLVF